MSRVDSFEIHAEYPQRAILFYQNVFGWTFTRWDGPQEYWLIITGEKNEPGIDGALMKRKGPNPPPQNDYPVISAIITIAVESVEETIKKVTENGGSIAVEKLAIPGVGWNAYCKDTEGNIFGIMEDDVTVQ